MFTEREVRCEVSLGESGNYFSIRDIFICSRSFFQIGFLLLSSNILRNNITGMLPSIKIFYQINPSFSLIFVFYSNLLDCFSYKYMALRATFIHSAVMDFLSCNLNKQPTTTEPVRQKYKQRTTN